MTESRGRIIPLRVWPLRMVNLLAVLTGVVLLIFDSPIGIRLPGFITRARVEAAPLLLVGIGFVAWLALDRPRVIDLIKQGLIALAFILWGIDLLMPGGQWATFVGAVVIAIYVFDLAWMMEGSVRKKLGRETTPQVRKCISPDCRPGGTCGCLGEATDK